MKNIFKRFKRNDKYSVVHCPNCHIPVAYTKRSIGDIYVDVSGKHHKVTPHIICTNGLCEHIIFIR